MKRITRTGLVAGLVFTAGIAAANLVVYDYSAAPVSLSRTTPQRNGSVAGSIYLSRTSASLANGELQLDLLATANHPTYTGSVTGQPGIRLAALNDIVNQTVDFSGLTTILSQNRTSYTGYVALEFDAGSGNFYYGWAEITANVTGGPSQKTITAAASILRLAYNNVANEAVVVGQTAAIPEPAVATLLVGFGSALLAGRRLFRK